MDIQEAIAAASAWTAHARPIAKAMLGVGEANFFATDWLDADDVARKAKKQGDDTAYANARGRMRDYDEAKRIVETARTMLHAMLYGIRDNYRCDYVRPYSDDMTEAQWDETGAFNEALDAGMISVDAFVRVVEGGVYG